MTSEGSRFLRIETVLEMTGLSRTTLYRKVRGGTFPRQVLLSERCTGWRESDVRIWAANPREYRNLDRSP